MKKIYETDPWLEPFRTAIDKRSASIRDCEKKLRRDSECLVDAANNHLYYGMHEECGSRVFREWAPNASKIYLIGDFNNWKRSEAYALKPVGSGNWEIRLPELFLRDGDRYKLWIEWPGGGGERIPAYATRVVQDPVTKVFAAEVRSYRPYAWKNASPKISEPFIYECHIGMSSEEEKVAGFEDFRRTVLPRVGRLGYNVLQIMALQEHPYYGSFGYQVSSFYALSSRFGTPEEFKALVDEAHGMGIAVIMDVVHSHSVDNVAEGLGEFDGRDDLYFYPGDAGRHPAWGSRCFDYGKDEVKYFLLSNLKYWMEEYRLDGFRFDGVTSMMYWDHGLGRDFGNYAYYFDAGIDSNAIDYLALANILVHSIRRDAITIAEDVSGMPGLAAPVAAGGIGFDYRMAMGVADHWIKWIKEIPDEHWPMWEIWHELTSKRSDEKTVSYAECHDQALVGDKTIIFRLIDKEMYFSMDKASSNLIVDRGIALHKLIRLCTAATAGNGYLNFMGNEFGHPEWIDFPREGNGWSYAHARRLWSLPDNPELRFGELEAFDREMISLLKREKLLCGSPEALFIDDEKKILVFRRKKCIFAVNFNATQSFEGYGFDAPEGKYRIVLDSDNVKFGGFGRLGEGETHATNNNRLTLYLPARCAVVLKKM